MCSGAGVRASMKDWHPSPGSPVVDEERTKPGRAIAGIIALCFLHCVDIVGLVGWQSHADSGRNAPLIHLLILVLYILFACLLGSPAYFFLYLFAFTIYFLTYLFPLRIGPLRFQAGGHEMQPNLA